MAVKSFRKSVENNLGSFPAFVIHAVLEWVLIILLFIDGFLAFIANEFSKFFELKIPCLLCTRIDHVLVRRNSDFYYNESICESHRKDISSLAYCKVHQKLSDIRRMCEGCPLSYAAENSYECDTYKSLVGALNTELDGLLNDDHKNSSRYSAETSFIEKFGPARCSCCGDILRNKPHKMRGPVMNLISHAPTPSPRGLFCRNEDSRNLDLPHIKYTELKFASDNESELPEDEETSKTLLLPVGFREDAKAATVPLLMESEDADDANKTPSFLRGNKFFGISLDSAYASPRFSRFQRKSLLEKSDLVLEASEGNTSSDAEGDNILNYLKRQVRLDRKSLISLYLELDEERSASAVAANNAMAMITRLQAEKAAVQMEALQYQRMMEEQAEYDQEALQVLRDLLAKREEEIKGLEAELEIYREKYGIIDKVEEEECEDQIPEEFQEMKSRSFSSVSDKSERESPVFTHSEVDHNDHHCDHPAGLLEDAEGFEREKSYLLNELRNLEKRVHSSSNMTPSEEDKNVQINPIVAKVSELGERLKALEEDSGFLKHAVLSLHKGSEGEKLLKDISQQLSKLRLEKWPLDQTAA
ncbi:GTD-binding domain [Dillenia turbinata]|uniref:GTD-binding domain n=1 Tax=Dillenia turbinata TaxID=194707 RepID=A0AAN8V3L1_9MAGN